jgi:hypothetical protein
MEINCIMKTLSEEGMISGEFIVYFCSNFLCESRPSTFLLFPFSINNARNSSPQYFCLFQFQYLPLNSAFLSISICLSSHLVWSVAHSPTDRYSRLLLFLLPKKEINRRAREENGVSERVPDLDPGATDSFESEEFFGAFDSSSIPTSQVLSRMAVMTRF